jgi:hypothetical protein
LPSAASVFAAESHRIVVVTSRLHAREKRFGAVLIATAAPAM